MSSSQSWVDWFGEIPVGNRSNTIAAQAVMTRPNSILSLDRVRLLHRERALGNPTPGLIHANLSLSVKPPGANSSTFAVQTAAHPCPMQLRTEFARQPAPGWTPCSSGHPPAGYLNSEMRGLSPLSGSIVDGTQ